MKLAGTLEKIRSKPGGSRLLLRLKTLGIRCFNPAKQVEFLYKIPGSLRRVQVFYWLKESKIKVVIINNF
jgi:hypothetical protein